MIYQQSDQRTILDRNLAIELVRVTEFAALAAAKHIGRGDEKIADQAGGFQSRRLWVQVPLLLNSKKLRGNKDKYLKNYTTKSFNLKSSVNKSNVFKYYFSTFSWVFYRWVFWSILGTKWICYCDYKLYWFQLYLINDSFLRGCPSRLSLLYKASPLDRFRAFQCSLGIFI